MRSALHNSKQTKVLPTADAARNGFTTQLGLPIYERFSKMENITGSALCAPVDDFLCDISHNIVVSLPQLTHRRGAGEFSKKNFDFDVADGMCKPKNLTNLPAQ